jgi:hypothetical protein
MHRKTPKFQDAHLGCFASQSAQYLFSSSLRSSITKAKEIGLLKGLIEMNTCESFILQLFQILLSFRRHYEHKNMTRNRPTTTRPFMKRAKIN